MFRYLLIWWRQRKKNLTMKTEAVTVVLGSCKVYLFFHCLINGQVGKEWFNIFSKNSHWKFLFWRIRLNTREWLFSLKVDYKLNSILWLLPNWTNPSLYLICVSSLPTITNNTDYYPYLNIHIPTVKILKLLFNTS